MKYVPLYIKTNNTLLSSMIRISELITLAKTYSINALTITDENMYGCMDFYKACISNNIKPIIGLSIKLENNEFVLYSKDEDGYKNLLKITTLNSENKLSFDFLKQYNKSLICIVPFTSLSLYDKLKQIFKENFIGYKTKDERNQLSGDNLIYFNEILYLEQKDEEFIKYLYGIRDNKILENVICDKTDNYLLSYEEFTSKYKEDIKNNEYIYDNCNLKINSYSNLIPQFKCPDNLDGFAYLKQLCKEGLKRIFGESVSRKYIDRLKYELDTINKMGFCNYFLIVWDYVKFAKDTGILVGPGRGSAAGSLVSYLLNITTVDPIKYDLLFERFLNPERITMPDIDIDFEYTRREEVINYCISKYGLKHVAPIITFGTLGSKQAIRDVGRVMDMDLDIIDSICKKLNSSLSLKDNFNKSEKLRQMINMNDINKKLFLVASKLEGIKRHTSIHAAGIVMSNVSLDDIIPLEYHGDYYLTGYSMSYLEEIGLLKMDFLALKNLTIINDCLSDINSDLTFDNIPSDDEDAIKVFTDVNTMGIFQFESNGIMNVLRKFKPNNFNDISSLLALYRPGPMDNIDSYINRKYGKEKIDYFHEDLVNVLKPTYGIIVYQEQIMQIANILAGFSYGEADVLRRAMSKKKEDILLNERERFVNRSVDRGYSKNLSERVYDLILKFASYGFNKAHSVSYAFISYKMAYLKAHYSLYFFKQLLNMSIGSEVKTKDYIYECKKNNINILIPSIEYSGLDYEIKDNFLICPLTIIKGVGNNIALKIIEEREKNSFKDIFDFVSRLYGNYVGKNIIQNLIDSSALDCFNYNHKTLKNNLDLIVNYGEIGDLIDDESLKPQIMNTDEYPKQELMQNELNVYGFYMSNHPVADLKLKYDNVINLDNVQDYFDKNVSVIIYVESFRVIKTKNNEDMLFITGSDETRKIEVVIFPKLYKSIFKINIGDVLYVRGKVEKRYDKYQISTYEVKKLEI